MNKLTIKLLFLTLPTMVSAEQMRDLDCIIEPNLTVELSSPVDGVIEEILVDRSDTVTKGQVLARLEASVQTAMATFARSRAEMNDNLALTKVKSAFAKRKVDRIKELYAKKAVSTYDKDEAETEAKLAWLERVKAQKEKKMAQLEAQKFQAALDLRTIRSPFSGIVVDRYVHPGESVKDKSLLKLAQIDPLKVEIIAPSSLFGQFKPGMDIEILPEAPLNGSYQAKVTIVDAVVDAASGTFGIRLKLPNPDHQLVGGLKCKARMVVK